MEYLEAESIDLLMVGSAVSSRLRKALGGGGGVGSHLVHHAACPVLVLPVHTSSELAPRMLLPGAACTLLLMVVHISCEVIHLSAVLASWVSDLLRNIMLLLPFVAAHMSPPCCLQCPRLPVALFWGQLSAAHPEPVLALCPLLLHVMGRMQAPAWKHPSYDHRPAICHWGTCELCHGA